MAAAGGGGGRWRAAEDAGAKAECAPTKERAVRTTRRRRHKVRAATKDVGASGPIARINYVSHTVSKTAIMRRYSSRVGMPTSLEY
jgi:hypothetical protein